VVDQLVQGDTPEFVLYRGVRGVGKTALLAYVRRQARRLGLHTLHVEADRDDQRLEATLQTLLRDLAGLLADADDRTVQRLTAVTRGEDGPKLRARGGPAATLEALVDDAPTSPRPPSAGCCSPWTRCTRAATCCSSRCCAPPTASPRTGVRWACCCRGCRRPRRTSSTRARPTRSAWPASTSGLLERDGTAEAVRRPFLRDADLEVDDLVIDTVHDSSGGYPWFVQLWGEALWDLATDPHRLELPVAREAGERVHLRIEDFYLSRWRRVPSGRATLLVLALADAGGQAATATCSSASRSPTRPPPRRVARCSTSACAGRPGAASSPSACPGFAEWVQRTRPELA
jgi:hypothetical protein